MTELEGQIRALAGRRCAVDVGTETAALTRGRGVAGVVVRDRVLIPSLIHPIVVYPILHRLRKRPELPRERLLHKVIDTAPRNPYPCAVCFRMTGHGADLG